MLLSGHKQATVYQQAVLITKELYRITSTFPDTERVVLQYSLRRMSVALCQHLAMAVATKGKKQRRFFNQCLETCVALDAQLEIACELGFVANDEARQTATRLDIIYETILKLVAGK